MFRVILSAGIRAGANPEVLQKAQDITNYINENYMTYFQNRAQFATQAFGSIGRIAWFVDYKNMALMEEYTLKVEADKKYQEKVRGLTNLLIEGSGTQQLFRIV